MKRVVATSMGFFEGRRVRPGEELHVPDNFKGSWVAAVGDPAAVAPKPKPAREPRTLSEIGRAPVKIASDLA
jgi:hypothetical protein